MTTHQSTGKACPKKDIDLNSLLFGAIIKSEDIGQMSTAIDAITIILQKDATHCAEADYTPLGEYERDGLYKAISYMARDINGYAEAITKALRAGRANHE